MDENAPTAAIEKMNELAENPEQYEEERVKVFNFFKTYFDSNVIFERIMEAVNE